MARVTIVPGRLFVGVFGTTLAARNCCFPFFTRSPKANTCDSLPRNAFAAAPHPPSKIAKDNTRRENFSGVLHARAAPALQPSVRKDGESFASLADERPLCEVFSIRESI